MSKSHGIFSAVSSAQRHFARNPKSSLAILGMALIVAVRIVIDSGAVGAWAEIGTAAIRTFRPIAMFAFSIAALVQFVGFILLVAAGLLACRDLPPSRRGLARACLLIAAYVLSIGPAASLAKALHADMFRHAFVFAYLPLHWAAQYPPINALFMQYMFLCGVN